MISTKRVFEKRVGGEGYRVLVDVSWPKGLRKESAALDEWAKDLAPSSAIMTWYWHDPKKWLQFQAGYREELKSPRAQAALKRLAAIARQGNLTIVHASREPVMNVASVVKDVLETLL